MTKWHTVTFEVWDVDKDEVKEKEVKLTDKQFQQVLGLAEKLSGDYD